MTLHFLASSACAYLTAEAWPISKPVQRLAGIRRLERNARRWRLRISRWIYEVTGPRHALRCFETRVETRSPPISALRKNYLIDAAYFGGPSPASTITSSFSPTPFLRRNAAASLYSGELKHSTPFSRVGNSITTKRLNFSGPSRIR